MDEVSFSQVGIEGKIPPKCELRGALLGECAPLPHLSCDYTPHYEATLRSICNLVQETRHIPDALLRPYPSIRFGLETAFALWSFPQGGIRRGLHSSPFLRGEEGIPVNGLVWMGTHDQMLSRMEEKLQQGNKCIKLKIGAIDFDQELNLIRTIRQRYTPEEVQIRLDANGAFTPQQAPYRLEQLAPFAIHSIEQPIRQGQWFFMQQLCRQSPIPIALDEELIGVNIPQMKEALLDTIRPQYIVIKPSLHGGITGTDEWIQLARQRGIQSWITSALESNVGLTAIAVLADYHYGPHITFHQGLGTGQLFTDNIPMSIKIQDNCLWMVNTQ